MQFLSKGGRTLTRHLTTLSKASDPNYKAVPFQDPGGQAPWMGREEVAELIDALRAGSGTYGDTLIHAFIQQSQIPHGFLFLSSLPVSEKQ